MSKQMCCNVAALTESLPGSCAYMYVCPDLAQDGSGRKFLNGETVQNHAFTNPLLIILGPFFVLWERGAFRKPVCFALVLL